MVQDIIAETCPYGWRKLHQRVQVDLVNRLEEKRGEPHKFDASINATDDSLVLTQGLSAYESRYHDGLLAMQFPCPETSQRGKRARKMAKNLGISSEQAISMPMGNFTVATVYGPHKQPVSDLEVQRVTEVKFFFFFFQSAPPFSCNIN